ncbi:hypothetical protein [Schumannella soli]|uniref:Tetratricopeptide repeat protein n=1 Tax=Schumannella soli TaxID=2590779 RepID=A0A506Y0H7_9MICO|nr:hypothetical protein [Schumannella soli]TPW76016.1 hypothetical protein FJ657_09325 [Schumannella soli]
MSATAEKEVPTVEVEAAPSTGPGTPWARLIAPSEDARRLRRRMLGVSLLLVVPVGLFAIGTFVNAIIQLGVSNSYAQKDYKAAASWARWGVSLNPIDQYLPHYNLGTAYGQVGLLPESKKELATSVANAGSVEQFCPAVANLELTTEKIGDAAKAAGKTDDARAAWFEARDQWQAARDKDCVEVKSFVKKADSSIERLNKKLADSGGTDQNQDQNQSQDPNQDQSQGGQGGQPSGQPSSGSGQPSGQPSSGSGQPSGQPSTGTGQPSGQPSTGTGDQGDGSNGSSGSGDDGDSSKTLGDKLGQLKGRDEQAGRNRDQHGDENSSSGSRSDKPW